MVVLQYVFMAVLVGVLLAAVVSFVVMGVGKVRRTRRLARAAHGHDMRFFPDDPYDAPRRYGEFAVISSGHSPRANNVTDGRLVGRGLRAFDFRCELGHGTRRTTRHYCVVVAEADCRVEDLLLWNDADAELAPLAARDSHGQVGPWSYQGPAGAAAAVAEASGGLGPRGASIEVRGSTVLVAAPARRGAGGYIVSFADVEAVLRALGAAAGKPGESS